MDEPKTFRKTNFDAISRGESIYIILAEKTGNNPVAAIKALSTILSALSSKVPICPGTRLNR
ncbi:MAG: hypothetical protein M0T73_17480 [Deltaproteobacteria bacterium]|nr:hypothetical protein [Deltaproteobacteria bacterium]